MKLLVHLVQRHPHFLCSARLESNLSVFVLPAPGILSGLCRVFNKSRVNNDWLCLVLGGQSCCLGLSPWSPQVGELIMSFEWIRPVDSKLE